MAKAISSGVPKMRIEEAAARTQARIDSGRQSIVGVNRHRLDREEELQILQVDNSAVRQAQIARLERLRADRNGSDVKRALEALTKAAQDKAGNLLDLAVDAARAKATVGEISEALEKACDAQKQGKTTILEVMCTRELGDPFRRDALKKPVRLLDKYKDYTVA